jgi:hypothetical protein
MTDEELSDVDVAAIEQEREIGWDVTPEGETSLERFLYVLDFE